MLRVPGCAEPLHLLVERGGRESTYDLRIFRIAYRPGTLSGGLVVRPSLHSRTAGVGFDGSSKKFSFLFQLPNPLLQELPLRFLLGQRQSFLVSGASLGGPAEPAVHIGPG